MQNARCIEQAEQQTRRACGLDGNEGLEEEVQRIQCSLGNVQLGLRTRCKEKFHFAMRKFTVPGDFHEALAAGWFASNPNFAVELSPFARNSLPITFSREI